ncbi:hypothetical protein GWI33_005958 [Rhynchophorus ferrugineus]|uniref:Uncharacterized protein n=1 Tax=Rhynchophorus ferrugineus TaxID=354439 RepID=A0A834MLI4_RHYFE|nr:hypothetical protein GWI33_005958 [Rhynchophorus ferrugineus]
MLRKSSETTSFADSSAGRLVGGCSIAGSGGGGGCHELDEIAVVSSSADPLHVKYGEGSGITCNGPRLVPGYIRAISALLQRKSVNYFSNIEINDEDSPY